MATGSAGQEVAAAHGEASCSDAFCLSLLPVGDDTFWLLFYALCR
jgi:hypothetical protein